MFQVLKYLPKIIFGFKDVSAEYKDATGNGRPWWLSRSFLYSALCFIGTLVTVGTGIELDKVQLEAIADNVVIIIPAIIAFVTAIMSLVAQIRSKYSGDKLQKQQESIRATSGGTGEGEGNCACSEGK
jgi:hypothetical protein